MRLAALRKTLGESAVECWLVLSATAGARALEEAYERFSSLPLSGLVFTRLDQAAAPAEVFSFATGHPLPPALLVAGRSDPRAVHAATAERLVALVLG